MTEENNDFGFELEGLLQKEENLLLKEAIKTLFGSDELKVIMSSDLTPQEIIEYIKLEIFYHFIISDFVKTPEKLDNALLLKKKLYMLTIPKNREGRKEIVDMVTDYRLQKRIDEYNQQKRGS